MLFNTTTLERGHRCPQLPPKPKKSVDMPWLAKHTTQHQGYLANKMMVHWVAPSPPVGNGHGYPSDSAAAITYINIGPDTPSTTFLFFYRYTEPNNTLVIGYCQWQYMLISVACSIIHIHTIWKSMLTIWSTCLNNVFYGWGRYKLFIYTIYVWYTMYGDYYC